MLDEIGKTAGSIYSLLEKDGPQTLGSIKKKIDSGKDLVPMGIGWLARENKLSFVQESRYLKIGIK